MILVSYTWVALMVYWLISARNLKRTKYSAPIHVRLVQLIFLLPGCVLLFMPRFRVGLLHMTVLPHLPAISAIGVGLTFAGVAFAFWARYILGSNWSSQVVIRENHELIQNGPYRLIRHPIYTGIITAGVGTAIVVGELGAFLGVLLVIIGFTYKGIQEELRLRETFGEAWIAHQQRTGRFLPRMQPRTFKPS
jgi:protein-S-isoprenylcysteine O-methyltransferase Ste14